MDRQGAGREETAYKETIIRCNPSYRSIHISCCRRKNDTNKFTQKLIPSYCYENGTIMEKFEWKIKISFSRKLTLYLGIEKS